MKTNKTFQLRSSLGAVLSLAALIMTLPTVASATIIASDNFDSYDGSTAIVGQSGASNNWATGWIAPASPSGNAVSSNSPVISRTPVGGSQVGGGNNLAISSSVTTYTPARRQLYNPITGTFYVGFVMRFNSTLNTSDLCSLGFCDRPNVYTNGFNMGINGVASGNASYYFIRKGTATVAGPLLTSAGPYPSGTNYLVFKVEKTGSGNYDKITGWLNPTSNSESTDPNGTAITSGTWQRLIDFGISSVSDIYFRGSAGSTANLPGDIFRFDGLALATSFADLMAAAGDGPANPAPVDTLRVETKADGSGVVVPTQTINAGTSITNFAIARDSGGANLGNVVATAWYLTNITGSVVAGDLVRSPDAKSTVFKGAGAGTAEIVAVADATNLVFSGTITVQLAPATQVRVETQPDGSGAVVAAQTLSPGQTVTGYAITRDAGGNFIANVAATWSLVNISGSVVSGDLVPAGDNLSATFTAGALLGSANIRATSGVLTSVDSGLITVLRQLTWSGTSAIWDSSQVNWFLPDLTTLSNFLSGDRLTFNDTGAANPSVILSGSLSPTSVTVAGATAYTFGGSGKITGAATLTHSGSALLTITNDNDYTGETTVRGNIQLGDGGSTGSLGTGKINFTAAGKTVSYNRTNSLTLAQQVTGTSSGTVAVNSGTLTLAGASDNTSLKVTVANNATVVLAKTAGNAVGNAGIIVNAGGVAKIGANNGQINSNVGSQIDGTMDFQGFNQTVRVVTGVPCIGVFDSTIFGAGGCTMSVGNSAAVQSFAGEIKDSGWDATHKLSLSKGGSFDVELGGTNSYHGNTTINQGSLKVMSTTSIPHGADFGNVVFSGGNLDLNGYDITVNGISGGDSISDGTATTTLLTVGDGAATASHSGNINGTFGVTKIGTGVQTFTGSKNYSGATVVSNGTLLINGTLANSPSVTVAAQAVLGGTGTISNAVTLNSGGTLAPGVSVGTLTINGALAMNAGSTNSFEVNGSTPTNDLVVLGAAVTYGGVLNIVPTGIITNGQTFTLFSGAGATDVSNFGSLVVNPPVSGTSFTFTNGVLTAAVILVGPSGPGTLTNSYSGGVLSLSWPAGQGWKLQQQTNALSKGLSTNWVDVTATSVSSTNIPVDPTQPATFYRLVYP